MLKTIFAFVLISISVSSFASTRTGNHTFYFDDRYNNAVEVYYSGKYKYSYGSSEWRPIDGSYSFSINCDNSPSCNIQNEVERIVFDFQTALLAEQLYTISFEEPVEECTPFEPCTQPLSVSPFSTTTNTSSTTVKSKIKDTAAISSDLNTTVQNTVSIFNAFKEMFASDDEVNFAIKKDKNGKFQNACYVTDGECIDELDVEEHAGGGGFDTEYEYDRSNEAERAFDAWLEQMFIGQSTYSCSLTKTCSTLHDGTKQCTSSYTCFYSN